MRSLYRYLPLLFVLFLACGKKEATDELQSFVSPTNLFVDHISSYTSGVISKASSIKVKLTRAVADSLIGTTVENAFSFSPSIDGVTSWEDARTLVFKPSEILDSDQLYKTTLDLGKVLPDIQKDKQEFKFGFQTIQQNYELIIGSLLFYDASDLSRVKIEGEVQTADQVGLEEVKSMVQATQSGSNLNITWEMDTDNRFRYVIEDVQRTEAEGQVEIEVQGGPIGVKKELAEEVNVPSMSDYKVISGTVINGAEQYISVIFSDPIDRRQNLDGLISISGVRNRPRLVTNLNEIKVYPTEDVNQEVTLTVNSAIKNAAGFPLKSGYEIQLEFRQVKPEVRLLSSENQTILPNSKGLTLPFEAVGLSAVEVTVIKIFEDNVLQYLQVNNLGDDYQLRRVGRPVLKKTIRLNTSGVTNLNSWNKYNINIEELLKAEPGSLYKIEIGFKKRHSLYFCGSNEDKIASLDEEDVWGAEEESSYWDSYEYGYNYDWSQRDNPCSDSYYGSRRNVSKILLASDLGLIAKKRDKGKIHVFATNLIDATPNGSVEIAVYDYQQQLIATGKTDNAGKVVIDIPEGIPFAMIGKKDNQVSYLKLDDGSALSLSNFNVSGTKVQNGLKGFLYGERGVWRPADTVHLGFIINDIESRLPDQHPVVLELFNPSGQLEYRKISTESVDKMYRFDFVTNEDAPTGNWQAKATVGGASFYKEVKIETIKPNRLKIDLQFDKEEFGFNDNVVSGNLNVRWLTGAKVSNLDAEYELKLKPIKTTFKSYPNFSFDDAARDFYNYRELVYEGKLDSEGYARMTADLGDVSNAPGALLASFYGKVYEPGGDFSISNQSVPYYPYQSFVGIKVPEGDKRGILLTDKDHDIRIASVDSKGNPISRKGLKVELYKLNWRWWWDKSYENLSNYVGRYHRDPIASATVNTTNGEGTWKLRINHPSWGRYYIRVTDPNSGHSTGQIVYVDWPGWAGKGKRGDLGGATMLDFGVSKEQYNVGEKVSITVPSTLGNRILVSLETGSEVLETFWVETTEESTNITFDATPDMAPNIYVHLSMLQPHSQTLNDLPIRLYGVKAVEIIDPGTTLKPTIALPSELRPEEKYTVSVSEASGKAMSYTLAVVDEGLLDITNFKTPDAWKTFYAREALGIKTWDIYDDVIGAFSGQMEHILAIGGDGEVKANEENDNNRFKPVVKFLGPFKLKAKETRKHEITMPQYLGSVKTMVVAASDDAYGSAEVVTPVKQPLMVLATLPRVAGPKEKMRLPVNVFSLDENIQNAAVEVDVTGSLALVGEGRKSVRFSGTGDKLLFFDIEAKEVLGPGAVKVTVKSGNIVSTYDVNMDVIPRNPIITDVENKVVAANETWSSDYLPIGIAGENRGVLEVSSLPPLNIESRLNYLIRYPHGCIEQTVSSVFAQMLVGNLLEVNDEQKSQIQKNVEAGISRLKSFQVPSGGFSYWPGNDYHNFWGSNYAGHFLLEARNQGYVIPEAMVASWIKFQTKEANSWGPFSEDQNTDLVQAYRLYTLALSGTPALGAMNRMKENTKIRKEAKVRLASAYALAGFKNEGLAMLQALANTDSTYQYSYDRYSYGSKTRDQAMLMETYLDLGNEEQAFEILMELAKEMGDNNKWMSTQTTAYCFISISKYASQFELDEDIAVSVQIGNEEGEVEPDKFINQLTINEADQKQDVEVTNQGAAPVFVSLIRSGIPIEGTDESASRNLTIRVRYEDLDGTSLSETSLRQGQNFRSVIKITNPALKGDYSDLALTQLFPSGWEIINTRLDESEEENEAVDYMDIRDDRVMHYFDLASGESIELSVLLNATYQGDFYLPSIKCEAMYDNTVFANRKGQWIEVMPE